MVHDMLVTQNTGHLSVEHWHYLQKHPSTPVDVELTEGSVRVIYYGKQSTCPPSPKHIWDEVLKQTLDRKI